MPFEKCIKTQRTESQNYAKTASATWVLGCVALYSAISREISSHSSSVRFLLTT